MVARLILLISVIWVLSSGARLQGSEPIRFDHLGIEQGLSQSSIQAILQDSLGFMWFATQEGLNKFDGYRFQVFKHDPFNPHSPADNRTTFLMEDSRGFIWVVTNGILNRYDRDRDRFYRYVPDPNNPKAINSANVGSVMEDHEGRIWVSTFGNGLFRYLHESDAFRQYDDKGEFPVFANGVITDVLEDRRRGGLWVGTVNGLHFFDPVTETARLYQHDPNQANSISDNRIPGSNQRQTLLLDDFGNLWVCTLNGLNRFNPETEKWTRFLSQKEENSIGGNGTIGMFEDGLGFLWVVANNGILNRYDRHFDRWYHYNMGDSGNGAFPVNQFHEDKRGRLWVSTQGDGLMLYQRREDRFDHYRADPADPTSLSTNFVGRIFEDRAGTLWFGTFDKGLNKYAVENQKFRHFLSLYAAGRQLTDNLVWSMASEDEERAWVGTRTQGLLLIDLKQDKVLEQLKAADFAAMPTDNVHALFKKDDTLWIGIQGDFQKTGALMKMDTRNQQRNLEMVSPEGIVNRIYHYNGQIWVAGNNGLLILDEQGKELKRYRGNAGIPGSISGNFVYDIAKQGEVFWIATTAGLNRFDPMDEFFEVFRHDLNDPRSLGNDNVMCVMVDRNGQVWAGTFGAGLNRFDPSSGAFEKVTSHSGLPNDVVYGILEDRQENLWLSTNRGLARYNPSTGSVRNYDVRDGLQSNEFNSGAFHKGRDGRLFFGGINGFNAFLPEELEDNRTPPQIIISTVKNFDQAVDGEMRDGDHIDLQPDDSMVEFQFTALDFAAPEKNRFSFMLEGFDKDWSPAGTRRTATYTNLNAGKYRFRVKASNSDGIWTEDSADISLVVAPAFYETSAFKAGAAAMSLLMLFFGFLFIRHRYHLIKEEELRVQDLARKSEELEYARGIQLSMLPERNVNRNEIDVVGRMITATEVGGDYYDFFEIDEHKMCIAYGDATGHGVAAGLVVGMVKLAATLWSLNPKSTLTEMVKELNLGLRHSLPARGMGMGFGMATLQLQSFSLEICSNGMPYPYIFRKRESRFETVVLKGPPLGFLKNIQVPVTQTRLEPGDYVIFMSDGFHERFNMENKLWSQSGMEKELEQICRQAKSADQIADRIIEACLRYAGGRGQDDDMTVVVLAAKQPAPDQAAARVSRQITAEG